MHLIPTLRGPGQQLNVSLLVGVELANTLVKKMLEFSFSYVSWYLGILVSSLYEPSASNITAMNLTPAPRGS